MSIWGKILGGAAGFALGGPLGALLGATAGHFAYDSGSKTHVGRSSGAGPQATRHVAFTIAVIALSAKLAKADGRVTRSEIKAFRQIFHVPPEQTNSVAKFFDQARRNAHGFEPYARQVAVIFRGSPNVLEELLACLFHIAKADGIVSEDELTYLRAVAEIFGFSRPEFERIRAELIGADAADPYQILGVGPSASDAEIKTAHRRHVREYHPDRLIAKGLPAEFIEVANQKLASINAAYDTIRSHRGAT